MVLPGVFVVLQASVLEETLLTLETPFFSALSSLVKTMVFMKKIFYVKTLPTLMLMVKRWPVWTMSEAIHHGIEVHLLQKHL